MSGGSGAPTWVVEINLCEQFHWTERQLRQENTVGFIRRIGVYNELQAKVQKQQDQKNKYQPAKPQIGIVGG